MRALKRLRAHTAFYPLRRLATLAAFGFIASPASAQLVVELPFNVGVPARVSSSPSWSDTVARTAHPGLPAARSAPAAANIQSAPSAAAALPPPQSFFPEMVTVILASNNQSPRLAQLAPHAPPSSSPPPPPPPDPLILSSFNGDTASGGVISTTSWQGNVTQGSGYITIGGSARDDNGWGVTGLSLNASTWSTISITAQRDPGNATGTLALQFEDRLLRTNIFSINTATFAVGTPTQAQIVIGTWTSDFDFTQIVSWSIGGGGLGTNDFRMTLHNVEIGVTAIPEPTTTAVVIGLAAVGAALYRRRRQ